MKGTFPVAAITFVLTVAGLTALAPTAHAEEPCQSAGSIENFLSFQQRDDSIQVELGMLESRMETSHGGLVPHCGAFCEVEGASRGCIDDNNRRVLATCRNGRWTPSP